MICFSTRFSPKRLECLFFSIKITFFFSLIQKWVSSYWYFINFSNFNCLPFQLIDLYICSFNGNLGLSMSCVVLKYHICMFHFIIYMSIGCFKCISFCVCCRLTFFWRSCNYCCCGCSVLIFLDSFCVWWLKWWWFVKTVLNESDMYIRPVNRVLFGVKCFDPYFNSGLWLWKWRN